MFHFISWDSFGRAKVFCAAIANEFANDKYNVGYLISVPWAKGCMRQIAETVVAAAAAVVATARNSIARKGCKKINKMKAKSGRKGKEY